MHPTSQPNSGNDGNLKVSDHPIPASQACTEVRRSDHPIPDNESECLPPEALDYIEELISEYLVCSDHQRAVLALWILHTYCYEASFITPYLDISSPVEESGKTACLGVLRGLCHRPWWASGVPSSTLTRKIIHERPTVLLDNWHATFRGTDKHPVTGFLANGCDMFQPYSLVKGSEQKGFSTREAIIYCPKAFAGLGPLPPALARHSIPIVLQRAKPQEIVKPPFALLNEQISEPFISWMRDWTKDHYDQINQNTLQCHYRNRLPGLSPHQQNCANVLIALAQTIGGHWPQKAHAALLAIFHDHQQNDASAVQLLSDIRDAFVHHGNPERIFTVELLEDLHSLDHRIWNEWSKNGDPMTPHALSRLLRKSFKIYSRSQRRVKDKRRGYQQSDFADAWERYLPALKADATEASVGNAVSESPSVERIRGQAESSRSSSPAEPTRKLPNLSRRALDCQVTQLPNPPHFTQENRGLSQCRTSKQDVKNPRKQRSKVAQY